MIFRLIATPQWLGGKSMFGCFSRARRLRALEIEVQMMRASIEALVTANQTLQTQVSAVSNYVTSLPPAGAGDLTNEESAALQSVTDGLTSASSTLAGLVPPHARPVEAEVAPQ